MKYTAMERALTRMVRKYHPGLAIVNFDNDIINWVRVIYPVNVLPVSSGPYVIVTGPFHKFDLATLYYTKIDPSTDNWADPILDRRGRLLRSWQCIADFTVMFNKRLKELKKLIKGTHAVEFPPCNYITSELMLTFKAIGLDHKSAMMTLDYNRRPETLIRQTPGPMVAVRISHTPNTLLSNYLLDTDSIDTTIVNLTTSLEDQRARIGRLFDRLHETLLMKPPG
jgi:hypothetical protein